MPQPLYVCRKCVRDNTVTVGRESSLYSAALQARDFNWIPDAPPPSTIRVKAKVRYRQPEQWATAEQMDAHRVQVVFDEPQRAITTGQAVGLYDGDRVLGGGTISGAESAE
jgi:tRNA-specific 2-thiouridylase